jgi:hypothetical protein
MYQLSRWLIVGLLVVTPSLGSALAPELFATEIGAQKHCPADIVVWVNTLTGIYHFKGMRWYGNTKSGAYVCKKEGDQAGYRLPVFCRYCARPGG